MKCTFSAREPNILMEAQPGDLFVPLGPDLVECVCAVRSMETPSRGFHVDVPRSVELDPNALRGVVVIACRIEKGEPEYYPTGFHTVMSGATPIAFLEQVEAAAFRERRMPDDASLRAIREQVLAERVGKYDIKCKVRFHDGGYVPPSRADADAEVDRIVAGANAEFRGEVPISRL